MPCSGGRLCDRKATPWRGRTFRSIPASIARSRGLRSQGVASTTAPGSTRERLFFFREASGAERERLFSARERLFFLREASGAARERLFFLREASGAERERLFFLPGRSGAAREGLFFLREASGTALERSGLKMSRFFPRCRHSC